MRSKTAAFCILFVLFSIGVLATTKNGESSTASAARPTLIYFVRHTEDEVALVESPECGGLVEDCVPYSRDGEPAECCVEVLNDLGELRARELARWFRERGITERLTHIFASHKIRSLQTVAEIGLDSGLHDDVDLSPGDGVQQIPPFVPECGSGFEIAHESFGLVADEVNAVPQGSVVLVSGHSGSIYPIMEALGIDTSDPTDFPRRPNGRIGTYNNLWIASVDHRGLARLKKHLVLDLELVRTRPGSRGDN